MFTEKELKEIDTGFMKLALAKIDFSTTLPLSVVCGNPATPWYARISFLMTDLITFLQVSTISAPIEMADAMVVCEKVQRGLEIRSFGSLRKSKTLDSFFTELSSNAIHRR